MVAFPGGSVDAADYDGPAGSIDVHAWAQRLRTNETAALGFVRAALRETEEETGVRLSPADLQPWAHWITPRFQPRRFDTWFFLVRLSAEQHPRDVSGEATAVGWVAASTAITKAEAGEWIMLPPTWAVFDELSAFGSVDDLPTDERVIEAITPGWIDLGDSVVARLPRRPPYTRHPPRGAAG
jgi:8-oxo-dGTP pyrophosphatase MutT (NUDIX family)